MSFEVIDLKLVNGRQLSFHIPAQHGLILQGDSGVGKTLCLRALADLDPHQGQVCLDSIFQDEMNPVKWRQKVQWVSAEPQWWETLVKEHFKKMPSDAEFIQLGLLPQIQHQPITQTSVGERQRLALLRSVSIQPQVLCLDEITANLDLENTLKVEAVLLSWLQDEPNRYLVWVSHDVEQIKRLQAALPQQIQVAQFEQLGSLL